jgi:colanic acid biosynthesis glycosyl transferase WcaI
MWFLSELYYPEEGTGYYVTMIAEGLAQYYPMHVLCAQPTYSARGTRAPVTEVRNGVSIRRCFGTTLDKDVLFFRILNLATITLSVFLHAVLLFRRGDAVIVVTNPPSMPFLAVAACWLRRAKCILLINDVYPDVIVAAGIARADSAIIKALDNLHRWLYRHVDQVIVIGRDMERLVRHKIGEDSNHVRVVTYWADIHHIVPAPRKGNALLERLGIAGKFVIQYSGTMGRTHDLESLITSAQMLQSHEHIHFLFIGFGAKEVWLRKVVQDQALKNVTVLPLQPRSDIPVSLNACDIAVVSFVSGMSGVSVPSRMYNILAAGKPILVAADGNSELAQVVFEERVGWVVKPEAPEAITQAILDASSRPESVAEMSRRARLVVEEKYSLPVIIQKYKAVIDDLSANEGL